MNLHLFVTVHWKVFLVAWNRLGLMAILEYRPMSQGNGNNEQEERDPGPV